MLSEVEASFESRIAALEEEVIKLKNPQKNKPSGCPEGDAVYEEHKKELLENHRGKVVAISLSEKKIAGIGSHITDAYLNAKNNYPDQDQFYFRKVGMTCAGRI